MAFGKYRDLRLQVGPAVYSFASLYAAAQEVRKLSFGFHLGTKNLFIIYHH